MKSRYHTRHCQTETGVEAANWWFDNIQDIVSGADYISVTQFPHDDFEQQSIIARINGTKEDTGELNPVRKRSRKRSYVHHQD